MNAMIVILVCTAAFALLIVNAYNRLIRLKAMVDEAWSGIDVQLKRRYDLVPNLVNIVKGYATHESTVFEKVAKMRSAAMGAQGIEQKAGAEAGFTGALKTLFAVAEQYPELKANVNFLDLQKTLNDIETELQLSRRYYNGSVRSYNIITQVFPSSLIASMTGFSAYPYFQVTGEQERQAPEVRF
jgi:LemA protein